MPTTREELEAAIDADPDQVESYLVLGDWLQQHQDPRGELIGLCRATGMDRTEDAKARIAQLERALGPAPIRYSSHEWFYGFVRSARMLVGEDDQEQLEQVLDHPSLRHLETLDLGLGGREDLERQWLIDLIASRPRVSWRNVSIDCYQSGGGEPPAGEADLTKLWAALPRASQVFVAARTIIPGAIRSETLTELEFDGEVTAQDLEPLLAGSAPNLRDLVLHDVGPAFRLALEQAPVLPLTRLVLPYADEVAQERIRAHYPFVTFSQFYDGDRYEQTGE